MRVTNGLTRQRKHRRLVKRAKGFRLGRKNVYKQVRLALIKQGTNAYRGRKLKKRNMRRLRIERLNAALRERGSKYSVFAGKMYDKNILLNRKVLSNIAIFAPNVFDKIYEVVEK